MQEGAGVRQIVEDGLRRQGVRLRDLDVRLELGLQGVGPARGGGGIRRDVHLANRGRVRSRSGNAREARVQGLDVTREISLATASGRARSRVGDAFVTFARERLDGMTVRWGPRGSPPSSPSSAAMRPLLLVTTARFADLELPVATRLPECSGTRRSRSCPLRSPLRPVPTGSSGSAAAARSTPRRRSRQRPACRSSRSPRRTQGAEWTPYFMRISGSTAEDQRLRREHRRSRLRARAHARATPRGDGRHRDERARPLRGGAVRRTVRERFTRGRTHRSPASGGRLGRRRSRGANGAARRGDVRRHGARGTRSLPGACHGAGARRTLRGLARCDERDLPRAGFTNEPAVPEAVAALGGLLERTGRSRSAWRLAGLGGYVRLRDFGVPENELPELAREIADRPGARANPRQATAEAVEPLLRAVW